MNADEASLIRDAFEMACADANRHDASHDSSHIERVHNLALRLAKQEGVEDLLCVRLAAILHDVQDPKYSLDDKATGRTVRQFLKHHPFQCPDSFVNKVVYVVENVSYSKEVKNAVAPVAMIPELAVVQDADRLDALGPIGIARVFAFTGSKGANGKLNDGFQHLHDKILHIKERLKTKTAQVMGQKLHDQIVRFTEEWQEQVAGVSSV